MTVPRTHRAIQAGLAALLLLLGSWIALDGDRAAYDALQAQGADPLEEAWRLADTWSSEGVAAPASLLSPRGLTLAEDRLWVIDAGNHRVQAFAPDRTFLLAAGSRGEGDGQLVGPQDVAAAGGIVFVTDPPTGRIVRFGLDGSPRESWALAPSRPFGLAASAERLYVSDPGAGEVLVVEGGSIVARWAGLEEPHGLDLAPDGSIHVADRGSGEIVRFSADGAELGRLPVQHPPVDVAIDERGERYVLCQVHGDRDGQGVVLWFEANKARSTRALFLYGFQAVTVDAAHGVYTTVEREDPLFHGVQRYPWRPRDGLPPPEGRWDMLGFPLGGLRLPRAVHAAPDGRIWIADAWPRAQAFSTSGRAESQELLPGAAVDLTRAPGGGLLAAELSRLHHILPDGSLSRTLRLGGGGREDWVTGLTHHPDGERLGAVDGAGARVRTFGLTTTLRPVSAFPLPAGPGGAWQLYWDLAVDLDGPDPDADRLTYAVNRSAGVIDVLRGEDLVPEASWPVDGIPTRIALGEEALFVLTTEGIVWKLNRRGREVAGWDAGAFSAGESRVVDLSVGADGRVYTVDQLAETVHVWEVDPVGSPERPLARAGSCRLRGDKTAAPETLRLGRLATVELEIGGDCPNRLPRADIVLAIDRSGSMMDNGGITATRTAALSFLDRIDLSEDRVALVAFNNNATLVQELTDDVAQARSAISGLEAIGGTDIAAAIRVSSDELFGPRGRADAKPVLILMTDGKPNRETSATLEAARRARERGMQIFTIGFGAIDPMVMALMATTPEDAFFAADAATLVDIYQAIADRLTADVLARSMTVTDELPTNMTYLRSVRGPAPSVDGRLLTWTLRDVPFDGIRLAYEVEPTKRGRHPTNVEAEAEFVDGLSRPGRLRFPVPEVEVVDLDPTATPTLTPVPTPTPTPRPVYLPITVRQRCASEEIGTDVVIVMDNSGSMAAPVREGGPSQLASAVSAAAQLVERMRTADRAAIVAFNAEARLVQGLTGDRGLLLGGLGALRTESGTRIDLGLEAAFTELSGERAVEGNTRAVVLLTDGRSAIEDEVVLIAAETVRSLPARLFVIGLGSPENLDVDLLRQVAGREEDFFAAPSADELAAIYASIAKTIECANLQWP